MENHADFLAFLPEDLTAVANHIWRKDVENCQSVSVNFVFDNNPRIQVFLDKRILLFFYLAK